MYFLHRVEEKRQLNKGNEIDYTPARNKKDTRLKLNANKEIKTKKWARTRRYVQMYIQMCVSI